MQAHHRYGNSHANGITQFDTVDHSILLDVLHERFGVDDGALKWFESYLRGRTNVYSTESGISLPVALACGVPQGSVMGPIEFIAYTEENVARIADANIAKECNTLKCDEL